MTDYENQTITESMKTELSVNFSLTDFDIWSTLKQNNRQTTDKKIVFIKENTVNEWIKIETKKIDALRETIKIIQSQIENHTDKLNDHKKTKNMRYHR